MSALTHRIHQSEQLDNLQLKGNGLRDTLDELGRINRLIGNTRAVCRAVLHMAQMQPQRPLRIVDLGCGAGDILIAVAHLLRKHGIEADLQGLDGNLHSVLYAQNQTASHTDIHFQTVDLLAPEFQCPASDIVISSHFLYHFSDRELSDFLRRNSPQIRIGWVIGELHRSMVSLQIFRLISPVLGLSPMSRTDGLLAIRRAFRRQELEVILDQAGLHHYTIKWLWSFRYLITLYSHPYA